MFSRAGRWARCIRMISGQPRGRTPGLLGGLLLSLWFGIPDLAAQLPAQADTTGGAAAGGAATEPAASVAVQQITFEQAVNLALERNNDLQRAANSSFLDRTSVTAAKMSFLPNLQLSLSGGENYGRFFSESEGQVLNQTTESLSARLSSSMVLFDGLGNVASYKQASLQELAGRKDLERARQSVVFNVISGYLALIEAREQVRIQREDLAAQLDQLELVRKLVEGGTRPVSDLYQQQASVASSRLSLVNAQRALELSRVDLVQVLQLDPTGEYTFAAPEIPEPDTTRVGPDLKELLAHALSTRPDLAAQTSRLAAAEQGERAAAADRWPSLSLSMSYGTSYTSASDRSLSNQLDERRGGSVALGVSVPIFDRYTISRQIWQARINSINAQLTLQDSRQDVALQVRRAILDLESAGQRLQLASARQRASQQALDATQERYAAGVATLYEVSQARADMVAAESESVSARYNLVLQDRLLRYYVGDLNPEVLTGLS